MTRSLAILALLAGCDAVDPQLEGAYQLAELLPDASRVQVQMPGDSTARSASGFDDYYALTRNATSNVNGLVVSWLDIVQDIVALEPTVDGEDAWAWGPFHQGEGGLAPTTEYFFAQRNEDGSYSYVLAEAPRADEDDRDAYRTIVAGKVLGGDSVENSYGFFVVDFTTAAELDPMRTTTGKAVLGYDFTGITAEGITDGLAVIAAMEGIADGDEEPIDAIYGYYRNPAGGGVMDLYIQSDAVGGDDLEMWDLRSRWTADGPGRADGQITDGDLGDLVVTVNDCWGPGYTTVYRADDQGFTETIGDESECAFAEESLPGGELPAWFLDQLD